MSNMKIGVGDFVCVDQSDSNTSAYKVALAFLVLFTILITLDFLVSLWAVYSAVQNQSKIKATEHPGSNEKTPLKIDINSGSKNTFESRVTMRFSPSHGVENATSHLRERL